MEYVYATLLLDETGNEINETNLTAVLEAARVDVAESRVKALLAALEGVDIDDVAAGIEDSEARAEPVSTAAEGDGVDGSEE